MPHPRPARLNTDQWSRFETVEEFDNFLLQRRKNMHKRSKPNNFRIITKIKNPFYEVAYSSKESSIRMTEWNYIKTELPKILKGVQVHISEKQKMTWLLAHFSQLALETNHRALRDSKHSDDLSESEGELSEEDHGGCKTKEGGNRANSYDSNGDGASSFGGREENSSQGVSTRKREKNQIHDHNYHNQQSANGVTNYSASGCVSDQNTSYLHQNRAEGCRESAGSLSSSKNPVTTELTLGWLILLPLAIVCSSLLFYFPKTTEDSKWATLGILNFTICCILLSGIKLKLVATTHRKKTKSVSFKK